MPGTAVTFPHRRDDAGRASRHRSHRECGFICIMAWQGPAAAAGRGDGQLPPAQPHACGAVGMVRELSEQCPWGI